CRVIRSLCIYDRGAVGVDLATKDIGVGWRQCRGQPFHTEEYVAVPVGRRRRPNRHCDSDGDEKQIERPRAQQQPARRTAVRRGKSLGNSYGRSPVKESGSETIEPISRLPTSYVTPSRSNGRSSPAIPTTKPSAAQQARAAMRGQAGANSQLRSTEGSRHRGCFCRGRGSLSRLSTRSTAASSPPGGACVCRVSAAFRKLSNCSPVISLILVDHIA